MDAPGANNAVTSRRKNNSNCSNCLVLDEKIERLKSLLARSSQSSKNLKEVMGSKDALIASLQASLSACDFNSDFDKALLSHSFLAVEERNKSQLKKQQATGERSSSLITDYSSFNHPDSNSIIVEKRLFSAQTPSKSLASSSSSFPTNELASQKDVLTRQNNVLKSTNSSLEDQITNLLLEKNTLQANNAKLASEVQKNKQSASSSQALINEMKLEVDLVSKTSIKHQTELLNCKDQLAQFETKGESLEYMKEKVEALTEWAEASAKSKEMAMTKLTKLEMLNRKIERKNGGNDKSNSSSSGSGSGSGNGDISSGAFTRTTAKTIPFSIVVGAGKSATFTLDLNNEASAPSVCIDWKFDVVPVELDISFHIASGIHGNRILAKKRMVIGGARGELIDAAVREGAILNFGNEHAWVRPKTIKGRCIVYVEEEDGVVAGGAGGVNNKSNENALQQLMMYAKRRTSSIESTRSDEELIM
jgi:hypothetical protein